MTRSPDPLQQLSAANPVPVPPAPDWQQITDHVNQGLLQDGVDSPRGRTRARLAWRRRRTVFVTAAVCAAILAAVLAIAPWSDSPGFLARAAAALTPGAGTVLYESWESTVAPAHRNSPERPWATVAPNRLWIGGASPHHYRVILQPRIDSKASGHAHPRVPGFSIAALYGATDVYSSEPAQSLERLGKGLAGHTLELGGTLEGQNAPHSKTIPRTLTFVPPDVLWSARLLVSFGAPLPGSDAEIDANVVDPVSELRTAIAEGRAHEAGSTQLDGQTVRRIEFDPPSADAHSRLVDPQYVYSHSYAYVEPKSLHPVEIVVGGVYYRFLTYEYLPATATNLTLTNIQAQHPNATIVKDPHG